MNERPKKITQSWATGGYPLVYVKQDSLSKMLRVKMEVWFKLIQLGFLHPNQSLRSWLDENGYKHIVENSKEEYEA